MAGERVHATEIQPVCNLYFSIFARARQLACGRDISRASQPSLLGVSNSHVEKDRKKIVSGVPLSPLLLCRDSANGMVVIANGYHRLCAVYGFNEDEWICCKIV